jgi:hypothetical protein
MRAPGHALAAEAAAGQQAGLAGVSYDAEQFWRSSVACFYISYDLPEGSDYGPLINAIKSYGAWAHVTESMWAVVADISAKALRDDLVDLVPASGRLFVAKAASGVAWRNVMCRNDWLMEHLP